jgi:hypothetical protein
MVWLHAVILAREHSLYIEKISIYQFAKSIMALYVMIEMNSAAFLGSIRPDHRIRCARQFEVHANRPIVRDATGGTISPVACCKISER